MIKRRYSITCDVDTMTMIDNAARKNGLSRSAVTRMLLHLIRYVPSDRIRETSPIPAFLGINEEVENAD